jgi:hypothetical protein
MRRERERPRARRRETGHLVGREGVAQRCQVAAAKARQVSELAATGGAGHLERREGSAQLQPKREREGAVLRGCK